MSRDMALDALEASMASIKESILNGEEVTLRGFGTFGLKERKEKVARNITKNTTVIIPAHKVVTFKP
ncbi:MAG: HU family DNA-binding protein, partial [Prevotella sp.]|nr:HU family DNA-binding protein [Prevotella sp.]